MAKKVIGSGETLEDLRDFVERTKDLPSGLQVRAKLKLDLSLDGMKNGAQVDTLSVEKD